MAADSSSLTWTCDACTFENNRKQNPERCVICNTPKDYLLQTQKSSDIIINKYKQKYGDELLSYFYPYPNTKGCNSGDTAVQCIVDNKIYLSGSYIAQNMQWLQSNKIGAILNCAANDIKHFPSVYTNEYNILLKQLPINDTSKDKNIITKYINESINFIDECIGKKQLKILIHCSAGISRSATILIIYLMKANQWDLLTAFKFVKTKRKYIYPNLGFWKLLIEMNNQIITSKIENINNDENIDDIKKDENIDDNKQNSEKNDINVKHNECNVLSMDILEVHAEELGKMKGSMYSSVRKEKVKLW
eukprot:24238_1